MRFLEKNEFEIIFEGLLSEVIRENGLRREAIVPERLKVLEGACEAFTEVLGKGQVAEIKFRPEFRSGGISITVPSVNLDQNGVLRLGEVLRDCNTFEVVPRTDGTMFVTTTVKGLFSPGD